jgi:hypothetical protein
MKNDGLLGRNFLKGMQCGAKNAFPCGAGHDLRKIMAKVRLDLYRLAAALFMGPGGPAFCPAFAFMPRKASKLPAGRRSSFRRLQLPEGFFTVDQISA